MREKDVSSLLALIPFLENNPGISLEEVAKRLSLTPREAAEQLNRVLMCGSPPYMPDDYIGFFVDRDGIHLRFSSHFSRPIGLTLQEALAVVVLLNEVGICSEGPFADTAASLRKKVVAAIGTLSGHDIGPIAERITVARGSAVPGGIVAAIKAAMAEEKEIDICYYSISSDRTRSRRVRPYGLVENTGDLYLVGYCQLSRAVRTFRVDRIKSVETRPETFKAPSPFDLAPFVREPTRLPDEPGVRARIRLIGESADWAREAYHEDFVSEDADGVILTIGAASPQWITRICLKFGSDAELLEPPQLQKQIQETLKEIRALYA